MRLSLELVLLHREHYTTNAKLLAQLLVALSSKHWGGCAFWTIMPWARTPLHNPLACPLAFGTLAPAVPSVADNVIQSGTFVFQGRWRWFGLMRIWMNWSWVCPFKRPGWMTRNLARQSWPKLRSDIITTRTRNASSSQFWAQWTFPLILIHSKNCFTQKHRWGQV